MSDAGKDNDQELIERCMWRLRSATTALRTSGANMKDGKKAKLADAEQFFSKAAKVLIGGGVLAPEDRDRIVNETQQYKASGERNDVAYAKRGKRPCLTSAEDGLHRGKVKGRADVHHKLPIKNTGKLHVERVLREKAEACERQTAAELRAARAEIDRVHSSYREAAAAKEVQHMAEINELKREVAQTRDEVLRTKAHLESKEIALGDALRREKAAQVKIATDAMTLRAQAQSLSQFARAAAAPVTSCDPKPTKSQKDEIASPTTAESKCDSEPESMAAKKDEPVPRRSSGVLQAEASPVAKAQVDEDRRSSIGARVRDATASAMTRLHRAISTENSMDG